MHLLLLVIGLLLPCSLGRDLYNFEEEVEFENEMKRTLEETQWDAWGDQDVEEDDFDLFEREMRGSALSKSDRDEYVDKHNKLRAKVSNAADIKKLSWDNKIASIAQEWADRCHWGHRTNLQQLKLGENLFQMSGRKPTPAAAVKAWYDEVQDYRYSDMYCKPGKMCGHYTQVVWAESDKIGCGIKNCGSFWFVVCNYSPAGNLVGKHPYQVGSTCSLCPSDAGFCENGLCSDCNPKDKSCECNRNCQCGKLKRDTCTCKCGAGFTGPDCGQRCRDNDPMCGANPGWPASWCEVYSFVKDNCPLMCGQCEAPSKKYKCKL